MKKKRVVVLAGIGLLCLLGTWLIMNSVNTIQAYHAIPLPLEFEGEYSVDGNHWETLTENSSFHALDGDLYLKGNFKKDLTDKTLNLYLDHIYMEILVNGELVLQEAPLPEYDLEIPCGVKWKKWDSVTLTTGDTVEIHLWNPHHSGNPRAYQDFLGNIYPGETDIFEKFILNPYDNLAMNVEIQGYRAIFDFLTSGQVWRKISGFVIVLSILLLGIAFMDTMTGRLFGARLWLLSGISLFAGCLIWADSKDIPLVSTMYDFNSSAALICQMLVCIGICLYVTLNLSGLYKKLAFAVSTFIFALDVSLAVAGLLRAMTVCESSNIWNPVQGLCCFVLLGICICRMVRQFSAVKQSELPALVMLVAALLEFMNSYIGLWQRGLVFYCVFLVVFIICFGWAVKTLPAAYRAQRKTEVLEKELMESRIDIMLSQMQPHFLYNSLTVIDQLCKTDVNLARKALASFSTYLRCNLNSLKRKGMITFSEERKHIEAYLTLEKLRFGELLCVEYDIQEEDFLLPVLSVQPLVENAVKHGLGDKQDGGTVIIATREEKDRYIITVTDDGVGFVPGEMKGNGEHLGIENIRKRLASVCGGELEIKSEVGRGTVAAVTIFKERTGKHENIGS